MPRSARVQVTLHSFLDDNAPHLDTMCSLRIRSKLRMPLAAQVRAVATRFIAAREGRNNHGDRASSPIDIDAASDGSMDRLTDPNLLCPVCYDWLWVPVM